MRACKTLCKSFPKAAMLTGAFTLFATPVAAHEDSKHCAAVTASVVEAGFDDEVTVTCSGDQALITSDTLS